MEPRFAEAGCAVVSNSSALRMQSDVPLVIPEVNAGHIKLIDGQAWRKKSGGYVVTNPNCSAIGLVLALAPLHKRFGLETVMAVTMQAVSGAGYPGVASLDILGNVIPYIRNEEEKMEEETLKLLGQLNGTKIIPAAFAMSAQCNRVAVEDGHTESVSVRLKTKAKREEIIAAWNDYRAEPQELKLPSAPEHPVVYLEANDRPQPRFDVDMGAGMTTAVGRLRPCGVLDWKFTVLSHNTIRGAAGAAVLNAELLKAKGYLATVLGLKSAPRCLSTALPDFREGVTPMIVMKFGGTSVEDARAIERVAAIVKDRLPQKPVVVVSAMAKVTDTLLAMARAAGAGERKTALKLCRSLQERHYNYRERTAGHGAVYRIPLGAGNRLRSARRTAARHFRGWRDHSAHHRPRGRVR